MSSPLHSAPSRTSFVSCYWIILVSIIKSHVSLKSFTNSNKSLIENIVGRSVFPKTAALLGFDYGQNFYFNRHGPARNDPDSRQRPDAPEVSSVRQQTQMTVS